MYEEMFRDLKGVYLNESRVKFLLKFHEEVKEILNRNISLNDLKYMFDCRCHPKYINQLASEDELRYEFSDMIDSFEFVLVIFINKRS